MVMVNTNIYLKVIIFTSLLCSGTMITAQIDRDLNPDDFVILDDLIVDGSACIGFDCADGLDFSFDTQILKENNLRILFDDTSAGGFPDNDWRLIANDSANGGSEYFSIEDASAGRRVFTVEAGARSNSLYVDNAGRVGLGTSTPSTDLHIRDGDSPTIRLDQDGTSGFAPQVWDLAGNETNFFVRNVSNGSSLPFRIRPTAPSNSIFIDGDGDVGLGTASPSERLHVMGDGLITGELDVLSDMRVKRNVTPIVDASNTIDQLNAVSYDMKTEEYPELNLPVDKQYGLIAQELQDILPSLVDDRDDANSPDAFMSINYIQLIPILIKANQEQSAEISSLKKSLHLLEERLEKLEANKE